MALKLGSRISDAGDVLWTAPELEHGRRSLSFGAFTAASQKIRNFSRGVRGTKSGFAKCFGSRSVVHEHPSKVIRRELFKREARQWTDLSPQDQVEIARILTAAPYVIAPTSRWAQRMDVIMLCIVLYSCLITPYQVALVESTFGTLFVLDRLIDLMVVVDMVLQCFTAFRTSNQGGDGRYMWVVDLPAIRRRYLTSWFTLDCLTLVSSLVDIAAVTMSLEKLKNFKVVRILRIFRLLRLASVVKGSRTVSRILAQLEISYATLEILKWSFGFLLTAHLTACAWALVGMIAEDYHMQSWLMALEVTRGPSFDRENSFSLYAVSLYWALYTILGIGYGDIQAQCWPEYLVASLLMLTSGILWTRIIGSATAAIGKMDKERIEHEALVDTVMVMGQERRLPRDLRSRVRSYFVQGRRMRRLQLFGEITKNMSPALRGEVALRATVKNLLKISFLRSRVETTFVMALAKALELHYFPPNEWIINEAQSHNVSGDGIMREVPAGSAMDLDKVVDAPLASFAPYGCSPPLTILENGLATRRKLLCPGCHWHEDMILSKPFLRDPLMAQSLNFCVVYTVSRTSFLQVLSTGDYPRAVKAIRFTAAKLALRRLVNMAAQLSHGRKMFRVGNISLSARSFAGIRDSLRSCVDLILESMKAWEAVEEANGGRAVKVQSPKGQPRKPQGPAVDCMEEMFSDLKARLTATLRAEGAVRLQIVTEALATKGMLPTLAPPDEEAEGPPSSKHIGTLLLKAAAAEKHLAQRPEPNEPGVNLLAGQN